MDITRDLPQEVNPPVTDYRPIYLARRSRPFRRGGSRNVGPQRAILEQACLLPSTLI